MDTDIEKDVGSERSTRKRKPSEKQQKSTLFFSRLDIARMLGCTIDKVIHFEKAGLLTRYKWGYKMVRYPATEVHRLIEQGRKSS